MSNLSTPLSFDHPLPIIPQPWQVQRGAGFFPLQAGTGIRAAHALEVQARWLQCFLAGPLGVLPTIDCILGAHPAGQIALQLVTGDDEIAGVEAYRLTVTPAQVLVEAETPVGIFYGLQTLRQLLPPEIEARSATPGTQWSIPTVKIVDRPRFGWRGFMLDVSRHFYPKEFVRDLLDQMAAYKLNVFHWHLTDDQGWRIEIKAFPQLTEVGAWRVPRTGPWQTFDPIPPDEPVTLPPPLPDEKPTVGGYYTQEEIREIVSYAAERGIMVIPEIDVPGHSLALIAALPELSCTGRQYAVNCGSWFRGIDDNSLCAGNDRVYAVLEKIFAEVAQLFPSEYVHVGGDECYKGFWEECPKCAARIKAEKLRTVEDLQSYFIGRVSRILLSLGKRLLGWEEISEGGLVPDAVVMSWRGQNGGIQAAALGHQIVMAPYFASYLNIHQSSPMAPPEDGLPLGPSEHRVMLLKTCYDFNPVPAGVEPSRVLGAEACLWTEFIAHPRHAQQKMWPRILALTETYWTELARKDWDNFAARLEVHFRRLEVQGVAYSPAGYMPLARVEGHGAAQRITLWADLPGVELHYSFDDSEPDHGYPVYKTPLAIPVGAVQIRAASYRGRQRMGDALRFPLAGLELRRDRQMAATNITEAILLADVRNMERGAATREALRQHAVARTDPATAVL